MEIPIVLPSWESVLASVGLGAALLAVYWVGNKLNPKCPHCRERIKRGAKVCRYCLREV